MYEPAFTFRGPYYSLEDSPVYKRPIIAAWFFVGFAETSSEERLLFRQVVFDWETTWALDPASERRLSLDTFRSLMFRWEELHAELSSWPAAVSQSVDEFAIGDLYYRIGCAEHTIFSEGGALIPWNLIQTLIYNGVNTRRCGEGKLSFSDMIYCHGRWGSSHEVLFRPENARKSLHPMSDASLIPSQFDEWARRMAIWSQANNPEAQTNL